MAWARCRRLKTGRYWYLVTDARREHPAGRGREGKEIALEWASLMNKAKRAQKAGMPVEDLPIRCVWTMRDLFAADMTDARRRGLRTARPQPQGQLSRRECHWRMLLAFWLPETNLDAITGQTIRAYVEKREATTGPAAINRDLAVLRAALTLARAHEESGYTKDPFAGMRGLEERSGARKPVVLTEKEVGEFIAGCWRQQPTLGAFVELLFLTASRVSQEPGVIGGLLHYPAHKGGLPRSFRLAGRLAELAAMPRAFNRRLWRLAVKAFGRPVRPHDLRHTALTFEGNRPGASLLSVQKLGGWKSPAMGARYLHPDASAIEAVQFGRAKQGRNEPKMKPAKRRASR